MLWAIWLFFLHWTNLWEAHLTQIYWDNVTAVAYINHQGGSRNLNVTTGVEQILHIPVLLAVYIPQ